MAAQPGLAASVSSPSTASRSPASSHEKRHHQPNGKGFLNPWDSFVDIPVYKFLSFVVSTLGHKVDTSPSKIPAVHKPTFLPTRETPALRTTWLGHASHYTEFPGGLRVLFDPVFTERCSPLTFFGPKRYTPAPCDVTDFPFLDIVVISHNHYDHLSLPTLQKIVAQFPDVQFFVPLGNKSWFEQSGFKNITELDWWEEREISFSNTGKTPSDGANAPISAVLSCLPAQHMTARTGFDKAATLWASWSVISGGKKLWFGGDTAYRYVPEMKDGEWDYDEKFAHLPHCPAFEEIGELRGPFDLGLIPIGAYAPRHLMSIVHADPYDAVNIFAETKCKKALGIHWGTWILTSEEVLEPPRVLKDAMKWKGLDVEDFETTEIGVSREY